MSTAWSWTTDSTAFTNATQAHQKSQKAADDDTDYYHQHVLVDFDTFCSGKHTAEEVLVYFLTVVVGRTDPTIHHTIFGLFDDRTDTLGKAMSATAKNTQLTNDLEELFSNTIDPSQVPLNQQVSVATGCVGWLIDKFNNDPAVQGSFNPTMRSTIVSQLAQVQKTLNDYFGPSGTNPYGESKITDFKQLQDFLGDKKDPSHAQEAQKALTEASSILTSTTQNINSALNEQVSQYTGFDKNVQSFVGSLMKSLIDFTSAVIQNLSKG